MKVSNLYSKTDYVTNFKFIKSVNIIEYDISKANINTLYEAGVITPQQYEYLYSLPKNDRENYVGNLIRFSSNAVYDVIKRGILEGKKKLFLQNNIQDNEVIRIANDAVFIMRSSPLTYTKFGSIEFKPKNQYSTFVRFSGLVVFFGCKMGDINLDVINLGKDQIELHANYMLTFIGNLFYLVETSTINQVIDYFLGFYNQYLRKELDIHYYRELNEVSMFTVNSPKNNGKYGMMYTDKIEQIDITYNAGVLRELYGIIAGLNKK